MSTIKSINNFYNNTVFMSTRSCPLGLKTGAILLFGIFPQQAGKVSQTYLTPIPSKDHVTLGNMNAICLAVAKSCVAKLQDNLQELLQCATLENLLQHCCNHCKKWNRYSVLITTTPAMLKQMFQVLHSVTCILKLTL